MYLALCQPPCKATEVNNRSCSIPARLCSAQGRLSRHRNAKRSTGFGPAGCSTELQGKAVRANWSAVALAFLGDSVWELYTRRRFFFPPKKTSQYYDDVICEVRAESQARYREQLMAGPFLSSEEHDILRWGSNAKITIPKRFSQSGMHAQTYRDATSLECLVGYLYLTEAQRLHELMNYVGLGDNFDG